MQKKIRVYYLQNKNNETIAFFPDSKRIFKVNQLIFWAAFCTVLTIVATGVKTVQKPVSGSNLFPVTASSEAGFSASLQSLPAVLFLQNVHGWTWFCSATSLTSRQTRYQVLYTDV